MQQFDFKRTSRKCAATGRTFAPGEQYISLLVEEDGELVRKDLAQDEFGEPPENCVGWWKSCVPDLEKGNVYWAPKDVLLSYFEHLIEKDDAVDTIYVMAILLIQKKLFRLLDTEDRTGATVMVVSCNLSKEKYEINVIDVPTERVVEIQTDLAEKLFTDIAPTED